MKFFANKTRFLLIALTIMITWFGWGSSFVAIAYTLDSMPPLLMMASRFLVAGIVAVVVAILLAKQPLHLSLRMVRDNILLGIALVGVGMGATSWAAARIDSGTTALLASSAPLWIALILVLFMNRTLPFTSVSGIAFGLVGIAALVLPSGGDGAMHLGAVVVMLGSQFIWAAASLTASRARGSNSVVFDAGLQMITGGIALTLLGGALGEFGDLSIAAIDQRAIFSWVYLVVVCSFGGFIAYGWLLANVSTTIAATHAFINPVVAIGLGIVLLNERMNSSVAIATVGVIVAVILLMLGDSKIAKRTSPQVSGFAQAIAAIKHRRRRRARTASVLSMPLGTARTGMDYNATPTPAFARRIQRPHHATDGMDALAIDTALDKMPRL